MKIILDFDHTIFDMEAMHRALRSAAEGIGIKEKDYKDAYNLETHWKMFSLQAFSRRLSAKTGVSEPEIERALLSVADKSASFLYSDSRETCEQLKNAGHTLMLLSWGDEDWQGRKIKYSGIADLFEEVITVTQLKTDYLKDGGNYEEVVLIDDKPAELKSIQDEHAAIRLLRMRRNGAKYSDQPTPEGMQEVRTMKEAAQYIEKTLQPVRK